MIEMERKSGILLLRRGNLSARIYCREGRVMAARLYGSTPMSGVEVVYKVLAWTDGHFARFDRLRNASGGTPTAQLRLEM